MKWPHMEEGPSKCVSSAYTAAGMEMLQASNDRNPMPIASGAGMFKCPECGKLFMHERTLKRHVLSHNVTGQFECTECGKQYSQSYDLERHLRRHTGDRPYKCCLCERQFLMSHHLNNHMVTHTGLRPYSCLVCGKRFGQTFSLKRHMRIHLRLNDDTPEDGSGSATIDRSGLALSFNISKRERIALLRSMSCGQCGKVFCSQQTLSRHQCHTTINEDEKNAAASLVASCGPHYDPPPVLQQQPTAALYYSKRGFKKPHRCRSCNSEFGTVRLLTEHTAVAHPEHVMKPYACSSCDKCFAHPYSLKRHRVEHGDGEALSCPVCAKRFAQQYELNRHVKSHRAAEQLICSVCSRQFIASSMPFDDVSQKLQTCDSCSRLGFVHKNESENNVTNHTDTPNC